MVYLLLDCRLGFYVGSFDLWCNSCCSFKFSNHLAEEERTTVVPAKSDSDVMFC